MNEHNTDHTTKEPAEKTPTTPQPETSGTAPAVHEPEGTTSGMSGRNMLIGVVLALAVLVLGYLFLFSDLTPGSLNPMERDVVALVNGEPITENELQNSIRNVTDSMTAQGMDVENTESAGVIESEALNQLINTELLLQAAQTAGYRASDEEIATEIAQLETNFGSAAELETRLTELNIDRQALERDVAEQLIVSNYLENETPVGEITVTQEELETFYASLVEQYGEQLPPQEEIQEQLEGELTAQKQREILGTILAELRAAAEVEIK